MYGTAVAAVTAADTCAVAEVLTVAARVDLAAIDVDGSAAAAVAAADARAAFNGYRCYFAAANGDVSAVAAADTRAVAAADARAVGI